MLVYRLKYPDFSSNNVPESPSQASQVSTSTNTDTPLRKSLQLPITLYPELRRTDYSWRTLPFGYQMSPETWKRKTTSEVKHPRTVTHNWNFRQKKSSKKNSAEESAKSVLNFVPSVVKHLASTCQEAGAVPG